MPLPRTPQRSGKDLHELIESLNEKFGLQIPNPYFYSPSTGGDREKPLGLRCYLGIKRLYFNRNVDLNVLLNNFEDWTVSRLAGGGRGRSGNRTSRAWHNKHRLMTDEVCTLVPPSERDLHLRYLMELIDDEIYFLNNGSYSPLAEKPEPIARPGWDARTAPKLPSKRRLSDEEEDDDEFHTAPNSPVKNPGFTRGPTLYTDDCADIDLDHVNYTLDAMMDNGATDMATRGTSTIGAYTFNRQGSMTDSGFGTMPPPSVGAHRFHRQGTMPKPADGASRLSFTTTSTSFFSNADTVPIDTSFGTTATDLTEPMGSQSYYEYLIASQELSDEMDVALDGQEAAGRDTSGRDQHDMRNKIIDQLLQNGPFSIEQSFPGSVALRYRYEIERVGRAWKKPLNRMLVGDNISFKCHEDFWKWIEGHSQRKTAALPEKSSRRAWDAAVDHFKTDKHSEVVVLTGDLDWCSPEEPGILKLRLNPLKIERTCRLRRRFGSDRFLSLTIPAPSRPPRHLRIDSHPTLLRESIAAWLTQNVHHCLGRMWRPFFVEEVKVKRKSKTTMVEPRFRVEFFAIDGVDFDHSLRHVPSVAPIKQECDRHTAMSLESLINWHIPREANINQSNCKLFQRFSLGLSKTFATVVLKPSQIYHLQDDPDRPVMNDGCALMSRSLANAICDALGIAGNTPSCFQGRIAGAKGLWMVDRHQSQVSGGSDGWWIQISDSQLKIKPHPHYWKGPVDDEQLTFEVLNWAKPLHPVELNIQLLAILEHGGQVKEYIAELTKAGIQKLYSEFEAVLQADSHLLCRGLVQRLRPISEDGSILLAHRVRRLEQWMLDDAECIVRLSEAGFSPQSFPPLRKRLGKYLRELLDRHVQELHIEVPLSTYAYCIADPYGVLKEDEVHFGFSSQWRDPQSQFEDNLLHGIDVLVGRLPAHLPSDIQRRKAVWKPELRHFNDVIVFPTQGNIPLAHMLSGGDYDGDIPWICWDQNIVSKFRNSEPPGEMCSADHFGLTSHSIPMQKIPSTEEFLRGAFEFNLTLSNLGRCTVEHEKIAYDESIDSRKAQELACLLSHLVDGRKGGVHLSEQAWQKYRKRISPRMREAPAYKNPERRAKMTNIIDYLKFEVAAKERERVLGQLNRRFPEEDTHNNRDEDLIRPYQEARAASALDREQGGTLDAELDRVKNEVRRLHAKWYNTFRADNKVYSPIAREAVEQVQEIAAPRGDHPLCHTWQSSEDEWRKVLASMVYTKTPNSSFPLHAFGETLCQIKARRWPSRMVRNEVLACYKISAKMVQHLSAREMDGDYGEAMGDDDDDDDEFEGQEIIEEMLYAVNGPGSTYDPDDGRSVE